MKLLLKVPLVIVLSGFLVGTVSLRGQLADPCFLASEVLFWVESEAEMVDSVSEKTGFADGSISYVGGRVGNAVFFNGATTVKFPSVLEAGSGSFTVEGWVYPVALDGEVEVIVSKSREGSTSGVEDFAVGIRGLGKSGEGSASAGSLLFRVGGRSIQGAPAFDGWHAAGTVLPLNAWSHVALAVGTLGPKIYVNGVFKFSANWSQASAGELLSPGDIFLGGNSLSPEAEPLSNQFNGRLDEVTVFSYALSEGEVVELFEAPERKCIALPECASISSKVAGWWPLDGHLEDVGGDSSGEALGGVSFGEGLRRQGILLDGQNDGVVVPSSPQLNFGPGQDFSIEAWIRADAGLKREGLVLIDKRLAPEEVDGVEYGGSVGYSLVLLNGRLTCILSQAPLRFFNQSVFTASSASDLRDGQWHHVALSVDRDLDSYLFVDGAVVLQFRAFRETGDLSNDEPLRIGLHPTESFDGDFKGGIDEVAVYRRALAADEVAAIYHAGSLGRCLPWLDDGLPAEWREQLYKAGYSETSPEVLAVGDPDGDGANNYQEFLAGTDPLDEASSEAVVLVELGAAQEEFEEPIFLSVTAPFGGDIRYTRDGTDPTVSSPVLLGGLTLFESTMLRAQLFVNDLAVSPVYEATYWRVYVTDDLIPEDWRVRFFGSDYRFDPDAGAEADPDQDGATNLQEFSDGTDPTDPASFMVRLRMAPVIEWRTTADRQYRVWRRDDLGAGGDVVLTEWIAGTGETKVFVDLESTNRNSFYYIELADPAGEGDL